MPSRSVPAMRRIMATAAGFGVVAVAIDWPMEVILNNDVVVGVAAWISGKALFAAVGSSEPYAG